MKQRLCVFVCTPDSYADILRVYLQFYKKNMKKSPYPLVVATNQNEYEDVHVIHSDKNSDDWTYRTNFTLKQVETEFVLLMCDDIFIKKEPDFTKIEEILDCMEKQKIDFCRLEKTRKTKRLSDHPFLGYVDKRTPYGLNLQYGIYRTEYLKNLVTDLSRSAWDIENAWNRDAANAEKAYFSNVVACRKTILPIYHGVYKGKWFSSVLKKSKKGGFLSDSHRETLPYLTEVRIWLSKKMTEILPFSLRKALKKALVKIGFHFVTND